MARCVKFKNLSAKTKKCLKSQSSRVGKDRYLSVEAGVLWRHLLQTHIRPKVRTLVWKRQRRRTSNAFNAVYRMWKARHVQAQARLIRAFANFSPAMRWFRDRLEDIRQLLLIKKKNWEIHEKILNTCECGHQVTVEISLVEKTCSGCNVGVFSSCSCTTKEIRTDTCVNCRNPRRCQHFWPANSWPEPLCSKLGGRGCETFWTWVHLGWPRLVKRYNLFFWPPRD